MVPEKLEKIKTESAESFGNQKKFAQSLNLTKEIFPNLNYLKISPIFFEAYNSKQDKGFIVDINNLEIRVYNRKYLPSGKKLVQKLRKNGLGYLLFEKL